MSRISDKNVAWIPPEILDRAQGQFREHRDDEPDSDPLAGRLVQRVIENPDDPTDGAHHYVIYEGDPADYKHTREA